MATPAPSWNTTRVYGTWHHMDGTMRPGRYKVTLPVRVTNVTDDVIIPAGVFAQGDLNITPGLPSLDIQVPCNDDPDNSPNGWQPTIEVTFNDAPGEKYVIDTPVGQSVNLRTVVLAGSIPAPQTVLIRGVPGGLAELDADGDVIDADGQKVTGGGGVESWAEIEALPDAPEAFPTTSTNVTDATAVGRSVLTAASQAAARTAIGAGTSNLTIGTTGSTAKAGNWQPTAADVTDATTVGRSVLTAADATAARTAIGAAAAADLADKATLTADTGVVASGRIIVATTPTPAGMQAGDLVVVIPE